jgi:hypothetical protein
MSYRKFITVTDLTNVKDEPDYKAKIMTFLSFANLSQGIINDMHLYYILFKSNRIDLNYF